MNVFDYFFENTKHLEKDFVVGVRSPFRLKRYMQIALEWLLIYRSIMGKTEILFYLPKFCELYYCLSGNTKIGKCLCSLKLCYRRRKP